MKTEKQSPEREKEGVSPASVNKDRENTEKGGPQGPEPTRYGDWERGGKCVDF